MKKTKLVRQTIKETFICDKEKLWNIIMNNENYAWRSDLSKIEIVDETHFIEYTKNNYPTYFTITSKIPYSEYSFKMENSNMKGIWVGLFKVLAGGSIEIEFTEEIATEVFFVKLLLKSYLNKQQKRYIEDLKKALK